MPWRFVCMIRVIGVLLFTGAFLYASIQTDVFQDEELSLTAGTSALCPETDMYILSRPESELGPTRVQVGIFINDILRLDDVQQFFSTDVYLILRWKDPRLANPARGETASICNLPLDRVWHPVLQFNRIRKLDKFYSDVTMIDAAGVITLVKRQNIDVSVKLNLENFPFDRHNLTLSADALVSSVDEVVLDVLESLTGREEVLSLSGWKVGTPRASITTEYSERRDIDVSKYLFDFEVQREWGFYVWRTIVPLFFIVFMSWAVFWIAPTQFTRIGLSATSMLTLIAYQFAFTGLLPRISYLTRSDRFTTCSSVLIFLALVESIAASAIASQGNQELAMHIDRLSRWIFPVAFMCVILFAFIL